MGGAGSAEYKKFIGNCYNAFLILRRSANLTLNLFSLMTDANIPDIAMEPDKVVSKVRGKARMCVDVRICGCLMRSCARVLPHDRLEDHA